ncbi:MAG: hypothetical protein ABSE71_05090 [Candidatus Micrarchaeaceae archaeon]|jgi:hypothetical protein
MGSTIVREVLFGVAAVLRRYAVLLLPAMLAASGLAFGAGASGGSSLVSELSSIQATLMQVGPALSAVLFVLAGIFYAIGQMLPPEKKASFHTAAVNIIIGAIVVGVLSVASTSLAIASTHLLGNLTTNSTV